ncbi:ComEC/Rec2 family competence protein [Patescibacteria group bacterium]|nr:ComEC/Rec2 family competence protein [Patescibacteria group bacterium]
MTSGGFLYATAAGACAGVAAGLFGAAGSFAAAALVLSAVLLLVGRTRPLVLFAAAAAAAAALGLVRTDLFLQARQQDTIAEFAGNTSVVKGTVAADPDKRATSLRLTVSVVSAGGEVAQGTLLAVVPRETAVSYGDHVTLSGKVTLPEVFETDTGRTFNYPAYLSVQGVSAMMQYAQVIDSARGAPSPRRFLFSIKQEFERSLERTFPEPDVSLMEGLLLGERRGLPQEVTQAFVASGLIHIVVLSGYNISIVSEAILRSLSFLPRTVGYSLGGVGMVLFALLTGGGATTVRACIMGLIAILARYLHRESAALRALALAAAGMALWNPLVLLHDPSFILSVLATFGLVTLSPAIERRVPKFLKKMPQVASIAASTIAVQLYILPALLYQTGILSFLALPANMLVLPMVPAAMLAGFAAGIAGLLHPALAFFAALPADLLLKWMLVVAKTTTAIPLSATTLPALPTWVVVAVYIPLTWLAIFVYRRNAAHTRSS